MTKLLNKFLASKDGNFAIILALALTPIMLSVGAAVDYSGFKRMENRMVISAETAMLAASRELDHARSANSDMTEAEVIKQLDKVFKPFFEANFAAGGYELGRNQYSLEFLEADDRTKVRIKMDYDTAVMRAFGTKKMTALKEMVVDLEVSPKNYVIDIVMCIDATGSMQRTLTAVQKNASTFNADLRKELNVGETSEKLKIRVRPIFYRDWEEGRAYQEALKKWERDQAGFDFDSFREEMEEQWLSSSWYYMVSRTRFRKSNRPWKPRSHKRVQIKKHTPYYYFRNLTTLNAWIDKIEAGEITVAGLNINPAEPDAEPPINKGLNKYANFIDLDPTGGTSETRKARNAELTDFLGSTRASGGADWPEAAASCMNEAIRSDWYDNQSEDARSYFNVPKGGGVAMENETRSGENYVKVTPIPVVVFWSDAPINHRFDLGRKYLSPTQPTNYRGLKNLWQDSDQIDQTYKLMIRFGPRNSAGWNTVSNWDRVHYGGSLSTGNKNAVKVIAEKILESIPDMLRVSS